MIASYAPHEVRREYLARKIAESRSDFRVDQYLARAEALIQRDQEEIDLPFGQNVRSTFHLADLFVDVTDPVLLRESINRFLELVFGNTFHTPTRDEYAMFHAHAAALRSAELGRQVGAAITTIEGDVIAVGTNEVPKAGGGLYWAGDVPDQREFVTGDDSNDRHKQNLLEDLLSRLRKEGWLSDVLKSESIKALAERAIDGKRSKNLSSAQITNLIEFGRAVHGEMAAISDAARRGVSVAGATMYVTTFPCHLCARHIVAAGISRLVYVSPYAKSRTAQLYPDSIAVDPPRDVGGQAIRFEPFVGIAPQKYLPLFTKLTRKTDDGKVKQFVRRGATPRLQGIPRAYTRLEMKAIGNLESIIESKGLMKEPEVTNGRTEPHT